MIFTAEHAENAEFSHFIPARRYFYLTLRPQRSLRQEKWPYLNGYKSIFVVFSVNLRVFSVVLCVQTRIA